MLTLKGILGALSAIGSALKAFFAWQRDRDLMDAGRAEAERDQAVEGLKAEKRKDEIRGEVDSLDDATVDERLRPWFRDSD